jgi:hypothetical protein
MKNIENKKVEKQRCRFVNPQRELDSHSGVADITPSKVDEEDNS